MPTTETEPRRLPGGTVIFRQGDPGHEMFLVSSGRVRVTVGRDDHEQELAVLGPGEFFGELSLMIDQPRTATATALEEAAVVPIDRDVFAMMMQDDIDIVFRMMHVLGRRLSEADARVEEIRREVERLRAAVSR